MPFAALDDEFFGHPKTARAGLDGAGLYARSLSYCAHYLTDGFVPLPWAREIAKPAVRRKVTDAGFWVEVKGGERFDYAAGDEVYTVEIPGAGFFIPDYLQFNPTAASIRQKRSELHQKRSEAGKKGAITRWQRDSKPDGKPDGKASKSDGKPMANAWQTDSPLPLPLKEPNPEAVQVRGERPGIENNIRNLIDSTLKGAA
jgi:hypothetical protein